MNETDEGPAVTRIAVGVAELDGAIVDVSGAFSVLVPVAPPDLETLDDVVRARRDDLARRCVGMAVVADDPAVVDELVGSAGFVPFPLTVLADESAARGWLTGQETVGLAGSRPAGGSRTIGSTPWLADYVDAHHNPGPDPVAARLAAATVDRYGPGAGMNVGEDQGRLLGLLVELSGARRVVEIGTFTGMSALWIARALPPDGRLTCLEIDDECLELARAAWDEAGVADRVETIVAPALDSLRVLAESGVAVDFAFVDADKESYLAYVDALLAMLAPGGLIAVDNTLWSGAVADPRVDDDTTVAIRAFNDDVAARADLDVLLLSVGDGLTLVRRL